MAAITKSNMSTLIAKLAIIYERVDTLYKGRTWENRSTYNENIAKLLNNASELEELIDEEYLNGDYDDVEIPSFCVEVYDEEYMLEDPATTAEKNAKYLRDGEFLLTPSKYDDEEMIAFRARLLQ